MSFLYYKSLAAIGLAVASGGAYANMHDDMHDNGSMNNNQVMDLNDWDYQSLYDTNGIRAEYLLGAEVFGPESEEIGNVENVILDDKNHIVAVIAEVGGFWDISDTHIAVPWEEVTLTEDGFQIPVTAENFDDYQLYENEFVSASLDMTQQVDDDAETGVNSWQLTSLLNDHATMSDGTGYGYVTDAIFSQDGELKSVIVESAVADYGYGYYAYPFSGYSHGWNPGDGMYTLPYGPEDVSAMEPFEYDSFNGYWN